MGEHPDRNTQFENIARSKEEYLAGADPVLSNDTKKREMLENFYRDGKLLTREKVKVYDHDFPSHAEGVVIPHGIYDLRRNAGYLHLGTSHGTSEFACNCLGGWRTGQAWRCGWRTTRGTARNTIRSSTDCFRM